MVAKSLNLDDAEIEESKRDLITREIGKFREVMKVIIIITFKSFSLKIFFFFFFIIIKRFVALDIIKDGVLISLKNILKIYSFINIRED